MQTEHVVPLLCLWLLCKAKYGLSCILGFGLIVFKKEDLKF